MGRRIAIVGGGISGLALAERLVAGGAEPVVLEAETRAGGKVRTRIRDGFVMEEGPNGFLDKEPLTRALAERIGLGGSLRGASDAYGDRFIFTGGKLRAVPTKPPAFFASDILPWWAKLRIPFELFSGRVREGVDESIADFGRRHLGGRATDVMLGAMVLGIYGGDVEQLSLKSCFPRMAELEREHRSLILAMLAISRQRKRQGLLPPAKGAGGPGGPSGVLTSCEGGLGAYVGRLAETLGPAVRTGVRVDRLARGAQGYTLAVDDRGQKHELHADDVVLACPADEAARLLRPLASDAAELAAGIPYAPMAVVHLGWPKNRLARPVDGFGFLVPPKEGRPILGSIFVSSIFPWRAPLDRVLFTVMIGGSVRPDLAALSDAQLVRTAVSELVPLVGAGGQPSLAEVVRWDKAIPQYVVGHAARVAEVEARLGAVPRIHLAGNAWRGIGFNDCIANATRLADELLRAPAGARSRSA